MLATLPLLFAMAIPAQGLEVHFEVKLLVRDRVWGRRVEVDQWSGGRLLLSGSPAAEDGRSVFRIARVLEDPWTFRWYPTRDEVKLGAAVHRVTAAGSPYDTLASLLEPLAREKYALWWDADEPVPGPPWASEGGRFWAERHATEENGKDPLPEHSTYPFHVLGPLEDRFEVTLRDGAFERVSQRMTQPWLPDGWARSLAGEPVEGYGYWNPKRPHWEPRTYETFTEALRLLAPGDSDMDERVKRLLRAMQPRIRGLGRLQREGLRTRTWRDEGDGRELQLLVDAPGDERFKLWVRVGYRASPPRTP